MRSDALVRNHGTISERIVFEQIALLFTKSPIRPLLHLVPGTIICLLVAGHVSTIVLLLWFGVLVFLNTIRFVHILTVRNNLQYTRNFYALRNYFAAGCGLVGLCYGIGLIIFMPALPAMQQVAILAVSATVVPGAMVSYSTDRPSFYLYLSGKFVLPILQCLFWGSLLHTYLALYGTVYMFLVVLLHNWNYHEIKNAIGLRISNIELVASLRNSNTRLELLSTIDSLTGLANRRHFDVILEKEVSRAKRNKMPISLLMLDIDYFKQFNDAYGHLQGDECLQKISSKLQEVVKRPGDLVARYGGEEFCIIMPDTDADGAKKMAEVIQEHIKALAIPHIDSSISDHVTISIGLSSSSSYSTLQARELIHAADQALYQAKNNGRNQIKSELLVIEQPLNDKQ